ncbi:hypothetical protein LG274_12090 [Micrococcus antarcticus]|uniref:hypothetical protein n=1 Tax=Micrococcus antarcticus TaxID=86171 RepID=UPI00384B2E39
MTPRPINLDLYVEPSSAHTYRELAFLGYWGTQDAGDLTMDNITTFLRTSSMRERMHFVFHVMTMTTGDDVPTRNQPAQIAAAKAARHALSELQDIAENTAKSDMDQVFNSAQVTTTLASTLTKYLNRKRPKPKPANLGSLSAD